MFRRAARKRVSRPEAVEAEATMQVRNFLLRS
jgi:hypothetical protein